MSAPRCERRWCGVPMIEQHDRALGRVAFDCPACKRNRAGLCRDCPKRLDEPNALRCRTCARARLAKRDLDRRNKQYREDPAFRKRMILRKRAERRDPESRARVLERERKSRARRRAERGPAKRDALDTLYQREWRRNHPPTEAQRKAHNARRRRRYREDQAFREMIQKHNAARKPLTDEQKRRRNERFRERYATDPAFRAKINRESKQRCRQRRRAAGIGPRRVKTKRSTPVIALPTTRRQAVAA